MADKLTPEEKDAKEFWLELCGLLVKYKFSRAQSVGALLESAAQFANRPMPPEWYLKHKDGFHPTRN